MILPTSEERSEFLHRVQQYFLETSFRVSFYNSFAEIFLPKFMLHAAVGQRLVCCCWNNRRNNCTGPEQTAMTQASMSLVLRVYLYLTFRWFVDQILGAGTKQPDLSLGFPELEDRPFLAGETGFNGSGTLTERRVESWLNESHGEANYLGYLFWSIDTNQICNWCGDPLRFEYFQGTDK